MSEESFGLFDYLNDITSGKTRLCDRDQEFERNYNPFMLNRGLSNNIGDVIWANELNIHPTAYTKRMHHDFLFSVLKQGRRYGKWAKETKNDDIEALMEYYQIKRSEAESIIDLVSPEELEKSKSFKGGRSR